jgi:hypothetical protein
MSGAAQIRQDSRYPYDERAPSGSTAAVTRSGSSQIPAGRSETGRRTAKKSERKRILPLTGLDRTLARFSKCSYELKSVPDEELLRRLANLVGQHRRVECELIAHMAEVDERRLYASRACSSMHAYCTHVLHLSDGEAFLRIAVARASRRFPVVLTMLGDGRLHLSGAGKLAPHLTTENSESVLARAVHKSKREIEVLVAELEPKPDVTASVRKLPTRPASPSQAPPVLGVPAVKLVQLRPDAVKNVAPGKAWEGGSHVRANT